MTMTRRDVLRVAGGVAVALPLTSACGGQTVEGSTGSTLRSKAELPDPFSVELPIPPVLEPTRTDDSTDYYEITQQAVEVEILPGLSTGIWAYNGIFPGPTIVSRSGRRTVVRHRNELPVPTVTHLHGGVTPPEHDGHTVDVVLPVGGWQAEHGGHGSHGALNVIGEGSYDYEYPMEQRAATLWYHDHMMDFTGPQVYRGLAGFHLIRDDEEEELPLPTGERDIPLMIADRSFAEDGDFLYPSIAPDLSEPGLEGNFKNGVLCDVILVNGAPWPFMEVTNTRYRFRILNASNARRYRLALDPAPDGASFVQIGSDGGLLGRPVEHDKIDLGTAERFDVVIDFSQFPLGTEVTMVDEFADDGVGPVMRLIVAEEADDDSGVPDELAQFEPLERSQAVTTRHFRFHQGGDQGMWTVNGEPYDPERIEAEPRLGDVEIWEFTTDAHHPVHVHLVHFQVLGRSKSLLGVGGAGDEPGPYDAGWKDTIDLGSGDTAEVIMRFDGYRGRYVFHCHNLEHEDMMMMANFEVV